MNNKKIILKLLLICCLIVFMSSSNSSADAPNVNFVDIRALGMGGAGIATMDGFSGLIYNPASLGKSGFDLQIFNVQANASKDVFDLISFIDDNEDNFDDFDEISETDQQQLLTDMDPFDNNSIGAGVYPQLGVVTNGFGIGVYATSKVEFKLDKGIFDPKVFATGHADIVYSAGYGSRLPIGTIAFLPNELYVGGAVKIINRRSITYKSSASDADFDTVIDSLKENTETGFGVDLGLIYSAIPGKLDVGVKVEDILSDIGDETMPMLVNVGAAYKVTENLLLAADYKDIFMHRGENLFNRLYMGGELALGKILFARMGFAQGYFSTGAGLNFGGFGLDGAIYGVEKAKAPGGDGDYNYAVRIRIGL